MRPCTATAVGLTTLLVAACATPAARSQDEAEVVAVCTRFLADYSAQRWDAVEAALLPQALSVHEDASRGAQRIATMREFLAQMKPALARIGTFEERIVGSPRVISDGAIASVWADFVVTSASGSGHGIDVFHLVRTRDGWKIGALFDRFVADK